jgi:hypothetical protein
VDLDPYVGHPGSGSVIICTYPDLDSDPDPSINKQKKVRKTLISTVFTLTFEDDVNVPSKVKRNKNLKKKLIFCWHLVSHWRKKQDPDPDPYVSGTDPRIQIRTKM